MNTNQSYEDPSKYHMGADKHTSTDRLENLNEILLPLITEMANQPEISHTITYFATKEKLELWRQSYIETNYRSVSDIREAVGKPIERPMKSDNISNKHWLDGFAAGSNTTRAEILETLNIKETK